MRWSTARRRLRSTPGCSAPRSRRLQLEAELAAAVPVAPRLHPALPELYRAKVADLVTALDGDDATAAREQVRSLIEHITLHPEGDGYRVEVRGELSSILAMAGGAHDKAAYVSAAALSMQVKLVAGTRNRLDLLLVGCVDSSLAAHEVTHQVCRMASWAQA